jgi:hypothetical protein
MRERHTGGMTSSQAQHMYNEGHDTTTTAQPRRRWCNHHNNNITTTQTTQPPQPQPNHNHDNTSGATTHPTTRPPQQHDTGQHDHRTTRPPANERTPRPPNEEDDDDEENRTTKRTGRRATKKTGRKTTKKTGRRTRARARMKDEDEGAKDPLKSTTEQSRVILSRYLVRHHNPKAGDLNNIHLFLNKTPHPRVIHPPLTCRIALNIFQMAIYIFLLQKARSNSQREPQAP